MEVKSHEAGNSTILMLAVLSLPEEGIAISESGNCKLFTPFKNTGAPSL
jgi:hypothetical protein